MPIFDQGYQHWSGQLAGPATRVLAITRRGVRSGMKGLILRLFLIASWLPALVLAFALCLWGLVERKSALIAPFSGLLGFFLNPKVLEDPRRYRLEFWTITYNSFLSLELYVSMILILMVGPNLISQDLRFNALPLYFSRPLRRIDYFLGKLGIIVAFLAMVMIVPSLIAYVLGLAFSLDITILRDTFPLLLSAILYGLIIAISAGLLVLALSSLSRNSRYIALFWIGIWSVGGLLGTVLEGANRQQRIHAYSRNAAADNWGQSTAPKSMTPAERLEWQRALRLAQVKALEDFRAEEVRAAARDWRPLVSYTANLSRVGQQLLGVDAAWQTLSKVHPPDERQRFLATYAGPQYPWYWSAGVLAGFFGLSVWILNSRVKSLDRLK